MDINLRLVRPEIQTNLADCCCLLVALRDLWSATFHQKFNYKIQEQSLGLLFCE